MAVGSSASARYRFKKDSSLSTVHMKRHIFMHIQRGVEKLLKGSSDNESDLLLNTLIMLFKLQ